MNLETKPIFKVDAMGMIEGQAWREVSRDMAVYDGIKV
jgi:hypothetical protein